MPELQMTISSEVWGHLSILASIDEKSPEALAQVILEYTVEEEYSKLQSIRASTTKTIGTIGTSPRKGRRGQPVVYGGHDPRLQHGEQYPSFAGVLRRVRPDLTNLLYDARRHSGDKAETILKRYELEIYTHLKRV